MTSAMSFGDPSRFIKNLYVERQYRNHPYVKEIIDRSKLPVVAIPNNSVPPIEGLYPKNLTTGKSHLLLTRNKGKFFKPCPGTKEYQCCGYHVLNIGMNCPMDCVYCILQAYLNNPWLSFFVNIEDMFAELEAELRANPDLIYRIGTGEFTDSMALDRITGLSSHLVNFFQDKQNAVLELKTKCNVTDNLLHLSHGGRTVMAWSLNSPHILQQEEIRTASLDQRLEAARVCAEKGYKLAFHFDPIIYHPGWQKGYRKTVTKLFHSVPADKVVWVSLGALRYIPRLKSIATQRFPGSRFFYQEFIEGLDGKSRYFKDQRLEMYKVLVDELYKYLTDRTCLYFCMESDPIWKEVFGFTPADKGGLSKMLDDSVRIHC